MNNLTSSSEEESMGTMSDTDEQQAESGKKVVSNVAPQGTFQA